MGKRDAECRYNNIYPQDHIDITANLKLYRLYVFDCMNPLDYSTPMSLFSELCRIFHQWLPAPLISLLLLYLSQTLVTALAVAGILDLWNTEKIYVWVHLKQVFFFHKSQKLNQSSVIDVNQMSCFATSPRE